VTIRVLIIDDSATMRAVLAARLSGTPDIQVVGLANNAAEGRALIKELEPDVVTLDIEMPGMNGLDFLDKIMTLRPMPVIIVSGLTAAGSDATARALALGAVDCYCKTDYAGAAMQDGGKLAGMVRQASQVTVRRRAPKCTTWPTPSAPSAPAKAAPTPASSPSDPPPAGSKRFRCCCAIFRRLPAHADRSACGRAFCPRHCAHAQSGITGNRPTGRAGYAVKAGQYLSGARR
jgi:chemotaxis response regulator CheB